MLFKEVKSFFNLPNIEHKILKYWEEIQAFDKRRLLNKGNKGWSFIDGPITANNPMGVHHAWGRTYKDLYQRFHAMRGFNLRYQNGFDCQGLWVEVEVEKKLGFKTKRDIEDYGIAEFVRKCKQRVLRYAAIQVEQSIRLGYWMDWDDPSVLRELADKISSDEVLSIKGQTCKIYTDNPERIVANLGTPQLGGSYFTFSDENNYTIWSVLKECNKRGWIYKDKDVMPWCPRCSTALSQHEIITEGYQEIIHPGLTVKFPIRGRIKESFLVWTTTPWTLTSNVAVAIHPELTYVKVLHNGETFYLAKAAVSRVFGELIEIEEEFQGEKISDWTYEGPFDELPIIKNMGIDKVHRVIYWDEVSEEEGTGIVHIAPGCGKEDLSLSLIYNLPALAPLDEFGVFLEGFNDFSGEHVYDSAQAIITSLRQKSLLFKYEEYSHRYPVCWRCGNELVFRLVDEWYISMGEKAKSDINNLRSQIIEVAKQVNWIPSFGLQQELDWLQNMEDWMISKKRYWGLALPIWECDKCQSFDVIGSKEELKSKAVSGWEEFQGYTPHRPWIDSVKIACHQCGNTISRIPEVGNPWLDAGIVAYSTLNYRTDRDYWNKWFPADFICESFPGQFRNWFYSMLTMSTILERKTPFLTCFGHGNVLAEDGREMHKSWGNAIWFDDAVETMGADVMRWMFCTNRPENNLLFGYNKADDVKKRFLIPLWNVYSFFVTYANIDGWELNEIQPQYSLLDRWIISKLQNLVLDVTDKLIKIDAYGAANSIEQFVDNLSKWYVRRSRRRFWKSEKDKDKDAGYKTLYKCLKTLTTILAPFIPFVTEEIYQNLISDIDQEEHESVHHNVWPIADESLIDKNLEDEMEMAKKISSLGRSARSKAGLKLRQPLTAAIVYIQDPKKGFDKKGIQDLIKDELNIKKLSFLKEKEKLLKFEVRLKAEALGKKHGKMYPKLKTIISGMNHQELSKSFLKGSSVEIKFEDQVITLLPEEVEIVTLPKKGYMISEEDDVIVSIDVVINEELRKEGLARDIVRRIQNLRKEAGFNISDKIITYYDTGNKLNEIFVSQERYISEETLSIDFYVGKPLRTQR
jgi:isoleucyl-tRNA synthetase